MSRRNDDNKQFEIPIPGTDPITKGFFVVDYAHVGYEYGDDDDEKIFFAGHITVDRHNNPFYEALNKTPLMAQDHPLMIRFPDKARFIKITKITNWNNEGDDIVGVQIEIDVRFEFLDNLGYFEEITTFKDNNLL